MLHNILISWKVTVNISLILHWLHKGVLTFPLILNFKILINSIYGVSSHYNGTCIWLQQYKQSTFFLVPTRKNSPYMMQDMFHSRVQSWNRTVFSYRYKSIKKKSHHINLCTSSLFSHWNVLFRKRYKVTAFTKI